MTINKILSTIDVVDKIRDSTRVAGEVPLAVDEYEINIYPLRDFIPSKRLINLGAVIAELKCPSLSRQRSARTLPIPGRRKR